MPVSALAAGLTPDMIVGDFDSANSKPPEGIPVVRTIPEKDDTDTILACEAAIEEGCDEIRLYCALGGRTDHTIANIQTMEMMRQRGVNVTIVGNGERIYLVHEREAEIPRFRGYVSVFSYGETCIVSEYGMKYGLVRYRLDNAYPLGVSNEVADEVGFHNPGHFINLFKRSLGMTPGMYRSFWGQGQRRKLEGSV